MFAELHVKSHYSFLCGASSPEELVYQAAGLGYAAVAITDECSFAGVVKAYKASEECSLKLIIGSEFLVSADKSKPDEKLKLILLAPNRTAYSEISALITKGRRRSAKGEYALSIKDLQFGLQHCLAIWLPNALKENSPELKNSPEPENSNANEQHGRILKKYFKDRLWLGVELFWHSDDHHQYSYKEQLSLKLSINMVACNDVHMHCKSRKPLQDTLTAIRLNTTVQKLGLRRQVNAERYLKPLKVLQHQYPPALLEEACKIAELCDFSMSELRYEYPQEVVPSGLSPLEYLRKITEEGAALRWPNGVPNKVSKLIEYELAVIAEMQYEYYFLTVYDIVAFARSRNILCQGRGSAANSCVCYCLYITEVDPNSNELLFERFISKERNEPPDIDVDFESQRREEVIQYIYGKYSRKRAALIATVITYRRKSAVRDVGKALGLPLNFIEDLNKSLAWWDKIDALTEQMHARNMHINSTLSLRFLTLVKEILGTPRHLSQHVGGFLITNSPTSTLVPIENAAMAERTIVQWDKYDIEILAMLKVDILGLGMLSAIQRSLTMINQYQTKPLTVQDIPREDPAVYDMLCAGDSIGVFQVESRAQISMLPRLKPRSYYDLVIQVAIVRPGPIQGNMVHPFLKRRSGEEPVTYANPEIKQVLERTLGVPIFQEQVIKLTMVAAGFSGGEADQLRRAMASWGKHGNLDQFKEKLITGMMTRGHSNEFANRLFSQIQGFGSYGFPESHSASFALLVYLSSWLKKHHAAAFYAGLLNSQPMGFYSPAQLIQDAKRHNITVLPICINNSDWEHSLEAVNGLKAVSTLKAVNKPELALRLGLGLVKGVSEKSALKVMAARRKTPFRSVDDIKNRKLLNAQELSKLVHANALHVFESNRRRAYWHTLQYDDGLNTQITRPAAFISPLSAQENMLADYQSTRRVSLNHHPMQLLRNSQPFTRCTLAKQLLKQRHNSLIEIAGLVTGRQRPGSASGVIFMTLEDETGNINVVLWKNIQERFRREILTSKILYIKGTLEISDVSDNGYGVANVIAGYVEDQGHALPRLENKSRDFY